MRLTYTILVPLLLFFSSPIFCQEGLDHIWLFGYATDADSIDHFGGSVMDFNDDTLRLYKHERDMDFEQTNASICDTLGNLRFYTNGLTVANSMHNTVQNGECCLSPDTHPALPQEKLRQGVILLPRPGVKGEYYVLHLAIQLIQGQFVDVGCSPLYYTRIDGNANDGQGKVAEKNTILLSDTLDVGKITATRHANGRDWWVVVPQFRTNTLYSILVSPEGFTVQEQEIGLPIANGLGQGVFSPDGRYYANITLNSGIECAAYIYEFDRCSGTFSDQVHIPLQCGSASAGAAVSANSRFLYLSHYRWIYQLDLWAEDIAATLDTVAVYDGYEEPIPGFDDLSLPTRFFLAQLAPNGKIYINTTNSVRSLHVINNPDLPGDSCDVQQHAIQLPTLNAFSMPNFPNYKLRSLAGSSCDTLGPVAAFSAAPDGLSVTFSDESLKSPTSWVWDFGDGGMSTSPSPVHEYAVEGSYEVCLSVSNLYGVDTLCQMVEVQLTSTGEEKPSPIVEIFPNPSGGEFWLRTTGLANGQPVVLELYSAAGQLLRRTTAAPNVEEEVLVEDRPAGVYFYRVLQGGELLNNGKWVVR